MDKRKDNEKLLELSKPQEIVEALSSLISELKRLRRENEFLNRKLAAAEQKNEQLRDDLGKRYLLITKLESQIASLKKENARILLGGKVLADGTLIVEFLTKVINEEDSLEETKQKIGLFFPQWVEIAKVIHSNNTGLTIVDVERFLIKIISENGLLGAQEKIFELLPTLANVCNWDAISTRSKDCFTEKAIPQLKLVSA